MAVAAFDPMRRLLRSPLLSNIFAVAGGTAAGQLVAFAFSPLITRIYSPETFGLQGVFLSLISILSPAIALRYPMAIVVAADDTAARHLARLSLLIGFTLSCLLGLSLLVAKGPLLVVLGAEALGSLIWFLPLALFCVALQDIATFRATRLGHFRSIGSSTVVQACVANLTRVLGGLAAPFAGVLVAVTTFAPIVQAALLTADYRSKQKPMPKLRGSEAGALLRRHRDFPLYRVPTDILNAASQSVPVILLAALFSPAAAGLYTLTRSVLNLPIYLIGGAMGNVLYTHFADLGRSGRPLLPPLLRSSAALLPLWPAIAIIAWLAAPWAFALVFGQEWREAGQYAQWLALWIGISIVNVPAVRLTPVINAQMLLLIANVVMLAARASAMVMAYMWGADAATAVIVFSVVSLVTNVGLNLVIMIATRNYDLATKRSSSRLQA